MQVPYASLCIGAIPYALDLGNLYVVNVFIAFEVPPCSHKIGILFYHMGSKIPSISKKKNTSIKIRRGEEGSNSSLLVVGMVRNTQSISNTEGRTSILLVYLLLVRFLVVGIT